MVGRVVEDPVLTAAEAQTPQGLSHDAPAELSRLQERIARLEPAHDVSHKGRTPGNVRRHHREAERDRETRADLQILRLGAGIRQGDGLDRCAVFFRQGKERVTLHDAVQQKARVPGQQLPVGLPARDAVRDDPVGALKAAQGAFRQRAENAVGLQRAEARPVQAELQQLHRGTDAPHP